jgi:hypothetical protein
MPNFNLAEDQFIAIPRKEERITKDQVREQILRKLDQALFDLFPNGETSRRQFLIGDIHGYEGDSLKVELEGAKAGQWYDFATGEGGDIFDLWGAVHGWDARTHFPEIISDMKKWLGIRDSVRVSENPHPQKPKKLEDLGASTGKWDYHDPQGKLIACVYRYDPPKGKQFRPLDVKSGKYKAPDPRPLYNQPGIAASDSVILVEGEKCAEALISVGMCATTAMGGADKTDWSPLNGKHVLVWPDNDKPGKDYSRQAIEYLHTQPVLSLSMVHLPDDLPEKWDAADAVAEKRNIDVFLKNNAKMVSLETLLADQEIVSPETIESLCPIPTFLFREWNDDKSPMPDDLIFPRILTPGGLLVFGGAPKVGKTDFLLNWLTHMAAGLPFLGMKALRPLRIFYLQTEVPYDYMRERIHQLNIDPNFLPLVGENLAITDSIMMTLNEEGIQQVVQTIKNIFVPDIIVIDPLRNVFDGKSENDNMEMMAFLQDRIEALRYQVNRRAGMILVHHTRKSSKQDLADDPFQALSGAGCLRSFYTTGMILHTSDEEKSLRRLVFELRCGKPVPMKHVDKIGDQWCEMDVNHERTVRKDFGQRCDGERQRLKDVILQLIFTEARKGKLYSPGKFSNIFDSKCGLGAESSIYRRIDVLADKGFIRFNKNQPNVKGKAGVMCVEDMMIPSDREEVDPETGEIFHPLIPFLPTHYKYDKMVFLPVEDPNVWIYSDDQQF